MAPFRSPSTSALCWAALSSTWALGARCASNRPVPNTAAMPILNIFHIVKPSMRPIMRSFCLVPFIPMSRFGHAFAIEPVADSPQRDEIARPLGLWLDLLSQIRHLVVHDTIRDIRPRPPNLVQQLRPCQHAPGVPHECRQ